MLKSGSGIITILAASLLLTVVYGHPAETREGRALSDLVICPAKPCILPADCLLYLPPDPNDPCACPTCADLPDCTTVNCAHPWCPDPVTPKGQCCPVCTEPITKPPIDCSTVLCAAPECLNPVTPEGQCCPVCPEPTVPPDCSTVLCLRPDCPDPVVPEGQCCPVCPKPTGPPDCSAVLCLRPDCPDPVVPEGECCGVCPEPTGPPDCSAVLCLRPDCPDPVVPEGECCGVCPEEPTEPEPSCPVEGQVFMKCGTVCPPTCANPGSNLEFCSLECFIGCQCPSGTVLDEVANRCVPLEECTCPPDCTRDFCVANPTALCNVPGPREIPGCFGGQCQLTFCPACYYSEDVRSLPGNCRDCGSPVTDLNCLSRWSRCIHRADIKENGMPDPSGITQDKFKCYRYPCQLQG